MTSDGDLIPVTRGDLLELWLLAHDGLDNYRESVVTCGSLTDSWLEEQEELLERTAEKLGNPCRECNLSEGSHKFGCSELKGPRT